MANNRLYITIALNWTESASTDQLLRIELKGKGWDKNGNCWSDHDFTPVLRAEPTPGYHYEKTLRVCDFNQGSPDNEYPDGHFRLFTYSIELDSLITNDLASLVAYPTYWAIPYLMPVIEWSQEREVSIDYFIFEDTLHRLIRNDGDQLKERLFSRLNDTKDLYTNTNTKYFYGMDEPFPGNFDSFKLVHEWLSQPIYQDIPRFPLVTATCSWGTENPGDGLINKPNGNPFTSVGLYNKLMHASILMPDEYPLKVDTQWNSVSSTNGTFVQDNIDRCLAVYEHCKKDTSLCHLPLIPVVQSYGFIDPANGHWSMILPPKNLQKCLQYLPLCYGVQGIYNYSISSIPNSQYGLIDVDSNGDPLSSNPENDNYRAIKAANEKIADYGKILQNAHWYGSKCVKTDVEDDFNNGIYHYTTLQMSPTQPQSIPPQTEPYHGYIQCGFFEKGGENYYMLVNRRSEFLQPGYDSNTIMPQEYSIAYREALPQTIRFMTVPHCDISIQYGNNAGLYDPRDHELYKFVNGIADITIPSGEASLLQIVSVLPDTIRTNFTAIRDVYAQLTVIIDNYSSVDLNNYQLNLLEDCCLYVRGGSTLHINSTLNAGIMSRIIVEDHSTIIINNADCEMETGSIISLDENACIAHITNSILQGHNGMIWNGIESNRSCILVANSTFKNANCTFNLCESGFTMTKSNIYIPANGIGIEVTNDNDTNLICIDGHNNALNSISSMPGCSSGTIGILMQSEYQPFYVRNTNFSALETAIQYPLYAVKMDSISLCNFYDCGTGIEIQGKTGLRVIRDCSFTMTHSPTLSAYGIVAQCNVPLIQNCLFGSASNQYDFTGILLDMVQSEKERHILGCRFDNIRYGIQSRESQVRLLNNHFENTTFGTAIGAKSLILMNDDAFNFYKSVLSNIYFKDNFIATDGSEKYTADLTLRNGHNDFYHGIANGTDFRFNSLQYDLAASSKIDVTGNFWGVIPNDGQFQRFPELDQPDYTSLFICESYDDSCNIPSQTPVLNRFDQAVEYEKLEAFDSAYLLYEQILHERVLEEKDYWELCIPKLFSLAKGYIFDYNELLSYYATEISNTDSTSNAELIWLMNTYQAFTCLEKKDYQCAANIISKRIHDPISEIDSLNAVMDLEIVYYQRDLDQSKRPLTTQYEQFHYPTQQSFNEHHMKHWDQLQKLYDTETGNLSSVVVPCMLISNCYPNPFNPSTTIEYSVPKTTKVKLRIYNIRGQLVKELVNQIVDPGKYKVVWEGKNNAGHSVASGVYFYRIEANGKTITKKMLMLK
ncbi:MAG TPA: T9SS type A sorting domain-containing protein [Candidatus Cloacimonadota bacterium]|nr:T9SS type A sorting domain-containing protein [Candidatus Cloacimonadota bacterium]